LSLGSTLTANAEAQQLAVLGTINAAVGQSAHGFRLVEMTFVEAASGTHPDFNSATFVPPTIAAGVAALTNASTIKIAGAPSGATNNYALWVDAGVSRFDGSVGVGVTTPATSAILELSSTTGALLVTRMTTTQRDALTAVDGMIIYNTTTATLQGRTNGSWTDL